MICVKIFLNVIKLQVVSVRAFWVGAERHFRVLKDGFNLFLGFLEFFDLVDTLSVPI